MFLSAAQIQKHAVTVSGKIDPAKEDGVLFATDIRKAKKGTGKVRFVRFRIGTEAAKKAGFTAGMRVDLKFDPKKKLGLISKVADDNPESWSLLGLKKNATGDMPLQLFFTWHEKLPAINEPKLCSELQITEEGIQFKFPEGTVSNGLPEERLERRERYGMPGHPMRRSTDRPETNRQSHAGR